MQCLKCGGTGRNNTMTSIADWACHACRGTGLAPLTGQSLDSNAIEIYKNKINTLLLNVL